MAQSGFTPIQLYSSPTPSAAPAASNLTDGEVAINVADGKLFYKDTNGNTQVIADSAYSSGVAVKGSGTNVVANGTVEFANSNGVTFGLSGSTITASVTPAAADQYNIISAGGNTAGTLATFSASTIVLAGGSNITLSQDSNTISIAAGAGGNITVSAGTTSTVTNNIVFADSNGFNFGLTSNTVTAGSIQTSLDIRNQLIAYRAGMNVIGQGVIGCIMSDSTNVGCIYPILVDSPLSFQQAKFQAKILSTNTGGVSFNIVSSLSTNSTNYDYTWSMDFRNIIYSKTGDTFSSVVQLNYPISANFKASVVSTSVVATNTILHAYTANVYATAYVGTATLSDGLVYSSATYSTQYNNGTVSSTRSTFQLSMSNNVNFFLSKFSISKEATMMLTSPTTLSPNTYWGWVAATSDYSYANSAAVTGQPAGNPLGTSAGFTIYASSFGTLFSGAFVSNELKISGVANAAPVYSDFQTLFFRSLAAGGNYFGTGYGAFTQNTSNRATTFMFSSTVNSTYFGKTYAATGNATETLYIPGITYQ